MLILVVVLDSDWRFLNEAAVCPSVQLRDRTEKHVHPVGGFFEVQPTKTTMRRRGVTIRQTTLINREFHPHPVLDTDLDSG